MRAGSVAAPSDTMSRVAWSASREGHGNGRNTQMVESGNAGSLGSRGPVLVADIGGTKIAAGVAEPGGRLITWTQVPTPRDVDAEQLWRTLEDLLLEVLDVAKVEDAAELSGLGCGCGGPMGGASGGGSPPNIPARRGVPRRERLAGRVGGGRLRLGHGHRTGTALVRSWGGGGGRRAVPGRGVGVRAAPGGPDAARQARIHPSGTRRPCGTRPERWHGRRRSAGLSRRALVAGGLRGG